MAVVTAQVVPLQLTEWLGHSTGGATRAHCVAVVTSYSTNVSGVTAAHNVAVVSALVVPLQLTEWL